MPTFQPSQLVDCVERIFRGAGASPTHARVVAESLVASDLAGHDSHGIVRVRQYMTSIGLGDLDATAEPTVQRETPVVALIDGRRGFGQVAARMAMDIGITKAQANGLAAVGLFNSGHVGRLGEWVALAAEAGTIGLAFCNGGGKGGGVTPFGGVGRLLGTNPVAAGIPVAGRPPIIVDFATSAVAEGKLRMARNRGKLVPEGLFLRADGQPSTNPEDFYAGGVLLPAAGHKGYGLSLLVECLGGLLTGHGSPTLPDFAGGNGVLFVLLSIDAFRPFDEFVSETATLAERVKAVPPAPGFSEVLLPGEPEARMAEERASAITVDDATWAQLVAAAAEVGVTV